VRALGELLPEIAVVAGCPYNCDPDEPRSLCENCRNGAKKFQFQLRRIPVVTLPLNATEECVAGGIDFNLAVKTGVRGFQPGLLAKAHRGILYVDEVNLLDDHIVDIILDAAASGRNLVEREGVSFSHLCRFILVGTMNPEEGELRPQLLDRFGLCVHIEGVNDPEDRVAIMERRAAFDEDPKDFCSQWKEESRRLAEKIKKAVSLYPRVQVDRALLYEIASYCLDVGVDGHRGDIIILKTAKTMAAYNGRTEVLKEDIDAAAELALPHRIRRQPLQDIVLDVSELRRRNHMRREANA
jgi:magnesium chelatase subunit I